MEPTTRLTRAMAARRERRRIILDGTDPLASESPEWTALRAAVVSAPRIGLMWSRLPAEQAIKVR